MSYTLVAGDLSFVAEAKEIISALASVNAVTTYVKSTDSKFVLCASNGQVFVLGTSTDATAIKQVSGKVKAEGSVCLSLETISGMLKGRKTVMCHVKDGKFYIEEVGAKFTAHINTLLFDEKDVLMIQSTITPRNGESLKPETVDEIFKSVKDVSLTDYYTKAEVPILFKFTKKSALVYSNDNFHIAMRKSAGTGDEFTLAIPAPAFGIIKKFTNGELGFTKSEGRLTVDGDDFLISIPETQISEDAYNLAPMYIERLREEKPVSSVMFSAEASKTIENMFSISADDTKMRISLGDTVKLSVTTQGGAVSDEFEAEVKGRKLDMIIDPRIFMDLYRKIGKNCNMRVFDIKGVASSFMLRSKDEERELTLIGTQEIK